MPIGRKDLERRFAYHPPRDARTTEAHEAVREHFGRAAKWLDELLPDGREKALTITYMEDAMMWANAAIARNGGPA